MINLSKKRLTHPLFKGKEWTFKSIEKGWDIINEIAKGYGWTGYDVQFELLDAEQFIARYITTGLPTIYSHWAFGKDFIEELNEYYQGIKDKNGKIYPKRFAYEMIINSNPSICYLNADNSNCMQLIVTAHAAVGHNHFFKNNYLFKDWTQAEAIVDYMCFARDYIKKCEIKYGQDAVDSILDSCRILKTLGLFKNKNIKLNKKQIKEKQKIRVQHYENRYNPLIHVDLKHTINKTLEYDKRFIGEENILYFCEKYSNIKQWKKEIIRIIRTIEQYFYPQSQTKLMNEGFAQFCEHQIMNDLYDYGYINEGFMMEYIDDNGGVMYQPNSTGKIREDGNRDFHSINPYYLGYKMFKEIKNVCELNNKDWKNEINYAVSNFRDDSFISQYLTPNLIKELKLFSLHTTKELDHYLISNVHEENSYDEIKQILADQYRRDKYIPIIRIKDYNKDKLILEHVKYKNNDLNIDSYALKEEAALCVHALKILTGIHDIELIEITQENSNNEMFNL